MYDTLIIIPTYNERDNIELLVDDIFNYSKNSKVLIVDDNSPDGTGRIADSMASKDSRVLVLHRTGKRGRGVAGIDAFKEALKHKDILYIIEMDADFSHDPRYIPHFLKEMQKSDVVIGSRFTDGGKDIERNFLRNLLSKVANFFIKRYLSLAVNDCSAGYKCFKRRVIASLDFSSIISKGPAIIEEILFITSIRGFSIKEIPIIFRDRYKGKTKLSIIKLFKVFMDIVYFKDIHLSKDGLSHLKELRKFGFQLGLAMNILGAIMFYRQRPHFIWFICVGSLNLTLAIVYPKALELLKKALDLIIFLVGRTVNTVTLLVAFYLIFAPIGVLLRLFRIDMLDQSMTRLAASYWKKRNKDVSTTESYERMG